MVAVNRWRQGCVLQYSLPQQIFCSRLLTFPRAQLPILETTCYAPSSIESLQLRFSSSICSAEHHHSGAPAPAQAVDRAPAQPDMAHPLFTRHRNVLLYIPNLIGYLRIGLTLAALACARQYPLLCVATYFLAFVCDELDGRAARAFNQTSTMGAVLDMVTDRVATTGLLALLCCTYPDFHIVFISLIALDIFSHWFQMYQTLLAGSSTHKDVNSRSWLVRLYYSNRLFMGFCCVCCEVLYLSLFLLHVPFYQQLGLLNVQLPAVLLQAAERGPLHSIVQHWQGLPLVGLVALVALPGVVVKQVCNWVQLRAAVQGLVEHDVKRMA